MIFALHKVLKNSPCVTKNSKKAGDLSRYAGGREKGLKILTLPPNARELTAMTCRLVSPKLALIIFNVQMQHSIT